MGGVEAGDLVESGRRIEPGWTQERRVGSPAASSRCTWPPSAPLFTRDPLAGHSTPSAHHTDFCQLAAVQYRQQHAGGTVQLMRQAGRKEEEGEVLIVSRQDTGLGGLTHAGVVRKLLQPAAQGVGTEAAAMAAPATRTGSPATQPFTCTPHETLAAPAPARAAHPAARRCGTTGGSRHPAARACGATQQCQRTGFQPCACKHGWDGDSYRQAPASSDQVQVEKPR